VVSQGNLVAMVPINDPSSHVTAVFLGSFLCRYQANLNNTIMSCCGGGGVAAKPVTFPNCAVSKDVDGSSLGGSRLASSTFHHRPPTTVVVFPHNTPFNILIKVEGVDSVGPCGSKGCKCVETKGHCDCLEKAAAGEPCGCGDACGCGPSCGCGT